MTPRERAILSMSDEELLHWWVRWAECPHRLLMPRLDRLLAERPDFQAGEAWGPVRGRWIGREAERAESLGFGWIDVAFSAEAEFYEPHRITTPAPVALARLLGEKERVA